MDGQRATERVWRLFLCVLASGTPLVALLLAGRGPLAPPPLTSPPSWGAWLAQREPVVAAFAVVRLLALVFAWYLVAVTIAGGLARLASRRRLVAALDRLTLPPLRQLLAATVSLSLSAGAATPAVAVAAPGRQPVPVVAQPQAPTTTAPTITMRRLPAAAENAPPPAPGPGRTWMVQPGQCFWSIAEAVVAERSGRPPSAGEIVPYWHRLIEANRSALADPDNPDLIFPGQVFTVPQP